MTSPMTRIVRPWRPQGRFLRELARSGSVSAACRASGLARRTVYNWREADADFRTHWYAALGRGVARLRDEAMERAMVGRETPVWHDGRIAGHVPVPDSRVLWKLLQSLQAETYGPGAADLQMTNDRATEHQAEFTRRLDAADKRVAVYEAERRAQATRANTDNAA